MLNKLGINFKNLKNLGYNIRAAFGSIHVNKISNRQSLNEMGDQWDIGINYTFSSV